MSTGKDMTNGSIGEISAPNTATHNRTKGGPITLRDASPNRSRAHGMRRLVRTCPTAALERLLKLTPLHITVQKETLYICRWTCTLRHDLSWTADLSAILILCIVLLVTPVGTGVYGTNPIEQDTYQIPARDNSYSTTWAKIVIRHARHFHQFHIFSEDQISIKALSSTSGLKIVESSKKTSKAQENIHFVDYRHQWAWGQWEKTDKLARQSVEKPYIGPKPACAFRNPWLTRSLKNFVY